MIRILFVCHGNICRSPMAEFIMKDLVSRRGLSPDIYIESAATSREELGNDMYPGAKAKLRAVGVPFERREARQITVRDYARFDHIIVMDSFNLRNIQRIIPADPNGKIRRLLDFTDRKKKDIADPWFSDDFDTAYRDILLGCEGLLDALTGQI